MALPKRGNCRIGIETAFKAEKCVAEPDWHKADAQLFTAGSGWQRKKPAGTGHGPEIYGLSDFFDLIRSFFRDEVLLPLRAARLLTLPYP